MNSMYSIKSTKAMTLIEVMVAVGIIGILTLALNNYHTYLTHEKKRIDLVETQRRIALDVAQKLRSPASIYVSLLFTENEELIRCVLGISPGCTEAQTDSKSIEGNRNEFTLFYQDTKETAQKASSHQASSMLYDIHGKPGCNSTASDCVFEVTTFYYATCPLLDLCNADDIYNFLKDRGNNVDEGEPSSTCSCGAQELHLSYEVKQVKKYTINNDSLGGLLKPLPKVPFPIRMNLEKVLGPKFNSECNIGATAQGYSSIGKPLCRCAQPYILSPIEPNVNHKGVICALTLEAQLQCKEGEVFKGLKDDGTAKCVPYAEANECITRSTVIGGCPSEYRLETFQRSECTFVCVVGQGGGVCGNTEGSEDLVIDLGGKKEQRITPCVRASPGSDCDYINKTNLSFESKKNTPEFFLELSKHVKEPLVGNPTTYSGMIHEGLVCAKEKLVCCKPK